MWCESLSKSVTSLHHLQHTFKSVGMFSTSYSDNSQQTWYHHPLKTTIPIWWLIWSTTLKVHRRKVSTWNDFVFFSRVTPELCIYLYTSICRSFLQFLTMLCIQSMKCIAPTCQCFLSSSSQSHKLCQMEGSYTWCTTWSFFSRPDLKHSQCFPPH